MKKEEKKAPNYQYFLHIFAINFRNSFGTNVTDGGWLFGKFARITETRDILSELFMIWEIG